MRGQAFVHFFEANQDENDNLYNLDDKLIYIIIYQQGDFTYRRL